jgi:hypothetical protein
MKKSLFYYFCNDSLSCSSDDESPFKDYKGKWILTQMMNDSKFSNDWLWYGMARILSIERQRNL